MGAKGSKDNASETEEAVSVAPPTAAEPTQPGCPRCGLPVEHNSGEGAGAFCQCRSCKTYMSHTQLYSRVEPPMKAPAAAAPDDFKGEIKVWEDVETGECVATLKGHSHNVLCVAVFPDGRRIVSASVDNTLKVWDIVTGKCVATLRGHSNSVKSVAVFPDGRRVVSGSRDMTLKVWEIATGKCVATLRGHSGYHGVKSVAVFPDGRRVVSGSGGCCGDGWDGDGGKVWDVATGKCVATLENLGRTRNPLWIQERQERQEKIRQEKIRQEKINKASSDYTPTSFFHGQSDRERAYRNHVEDLKTHNRTLENITSSRNYPSETEICRSGWYETL